jgi:hypothetical protein
LALKNLREKKKKREGEKERVESVDESEGVCTRNKDGEEEAGGGDGGRKGGGE